MIRHWLPIGLLLLAGCSGRSSEPSAQWANEFEELAFLSSLSNPTAEQWKRRNALDAWVVRAAKEQAAKDAKEDAEQAIVERKRNAEDAKREQPGKVAALMESAKKNEAEGMHGVAALFYKDVIEKYPDAPEVPVAIERKAECDRLNSATDKPR